MQKGCLLFFLKNLVGFTNNNCIHLPAEHGCPPADTIVQVKMRQYPARKQVNIPLPQRRWNQVMAKSRFNRQKKEEPP